MKNRCGLVPFEEVLKDKEYYIELFSEGNDGLRDLLRYCFDNNITTLSCCGDDTPMVVFIINDQNRAILEHLYSSLKDLPSKDQEKIEASLCYSNVNDKELLALYLPSSDESVKYFKLVTAILKEKELQRDEAFDLSLALSYRLAKYVFDNNISRGYTHIDGEFYPDSFVLYFFFNDDRTHLNEAASIFSKCDYTISYSDEPFYGHLLISDLDKLRKMTYESYDNKELMDQKLGIIKKLINKVSK